MARKGKPQKGKFDIQPGMVFNMRALKYLHPNGEVIGAEYHPFLVMDVKDDYVEIVMCKTIACNNENKNRFYKLKKYDNVAEIENSCPPMENDDTRKGGISMDTFCMIPKKDLFSKKLQVWNENSETRNFKTEGLKSLCLDQNEVQRLRHKTMDFLYHHPEVKYDPYDCEYSEKQLEKLEKGEMVESSFTLEMYERKFNYEDLPEASPFFLLPREEDLHAYEKQDKNLLHAINPNKYPKPLSRKDVEQHNALLSNMNVENQNTSYSFT